MTGQILILGGLYLTGFLFITLFYPKVNIFIAATTALFWGALINTLSGIFLGLFGWYSWAIWVLYIIFDLIMLVFHIRRKAIWQQADWKSIFASQIAMLLLFSIVCLATGGIHRWMTSSASLPYVIYGSHIHHYGSILLPGAGYFFRSHYGISEALIHALGGFIGTPAMTLWHPFLWASLYAFLGAAFYDLTAHIRIKRILKILIGSVTVIWSATASMNWFYSFYIHVHLLTTGSILIYSYFFIHLINSEESRHDLGLLGALTLLLFGFSRVESPILILITLAILITQKRYSKEEIRSTFIPPLMAIIFWITFLFLGYQSFETDFWSDSRLLFALGIYSMALVVILAWNRSLMNLASTHLTKLINAGLLTLPVVFTVLNPQKLIMNLNAMLTSMFGTFQQPGGGVWNFHFWAAGLALISILVISRPWLRKPSMSRNYTSIVQFLLSYWMAILALGFFREMPYDGSRWGDSACRMISHLAPLAALFIGVWLVEIIGMHDTQNNISKPRNQ